MLRCLHKPIKYREVCLSLNEGEVIRINCTWRYVIICVCQFFLCCKATGKSVSYIYTNFSSASPANCNYRCLFRARGVTLSDNVHENDHRLSASKSINWIVRCYISIQLNVISFPPVGTRTTYLNLSNQWTTYSPSGLPPWGELE